MNKNIIIVLGGAVVIALVVAVLVQVMLGGKGDALPVIEEAKVEILVANKSLKMGQELKAGDVRWQEWPKKSVFPGALVRKEKEKPSDVLEGRLARHVAKGEPVMKNALLSDERGNFVAASLGAGMRAVAIEVSASSMVGGFIGPGDYVDVILTYKESINTNDDDPRVQTMISLNLRKYATETILQNVKILAVDQKAQRPEKGKVKVAKTVSVAVGVQDAERLALAKEMGELTLSLRGVGDDTIVAKEWETISDARLTKMNDEIYDKYQKMKKDTGINPNIVRVYNGADVQSVQTK